MLPPTSSTLFPYTTLFRSAAQLLVLGRDLVEGLDHLRLQLGLDGGERHLVLELVVVHVGLDRKSTRLNSSHGYISYAVFCLKKKTTKYIQHCTIQDSIWFH